MAKVNDWAVVRKSTEQYVCDLDPCGPSMTKQEFADECDINVLMKKYEKDGLLLHVNKYQGQYGDFTTAPDYHEAMTKVAQADSMFLSLPGPVRAEFDNDPGKFLAFVDDPANLKKMVEMGLMKPDYVLPEETPSEPAPAPAPSK